MGTFDRARSHQGIPVDRAGTHIAMFVTWLIERDLLADDHLGEPTTAWYIGRIRSRERTARDLVADLFHDQLTEADLSPAGIEFTTAYYDRYLDDYARVFADVPSIYDVEDTWENFDRLVVMLDYRLNQFRRWRERHGERLAG